MSSQRLPGKVITPVHGIPLIGHLLERLKHCEGIESCIVATSREPADDAVEEVAAQWGAPSFRGELNDVAARMIGAAAAARARIVVRISGDSPMLDVAIVARALSIYFEEKADLVSNVQERTFPKGQSVEVFSREVLERAWEAGMSDSEKEHVTPYLYAHPERFAIRNFRHEPPRPEVQLSVDTPADLERCRRILGVLGAPYWTHGLPDLIRAYDSLT